MTEYRITSKSRKAQTQLIRRMLKDSDGDGVPDDVEEQEGTDPTDKNTSRIPDGMVYLTM